MYINYELDKLIIYLIHKLISALIKYIEKRYDSLHFEHC